MKKFISLLVVAAFALTLVPVAKADTISDLMAQIAALQAQIAALSGTTTTGTTCFSTNLKLGMRTADVKLLQEKLGVSNTGYFGPLTLAAVKTFQGANGVPTTGFVGELTRAKLNAKYCVASTTTTTVAGTTGAATEGSILTSTAPIAAISTVYGGDTNKIVYAFNVKASNSDVTLKKVDVKITTATTGFPWRSFSKFYLYDGSTMVGSIDATQASLIETTFGSSYSARFDGLNLAIAKNATKTLTVQADVIANPLDKVAFSFGLDGDNAVRAVDSLGLNQYDGAFGSANPVTVVQANTGTLTISKDVNTPVSNYVLIDDVDTTSDVPVLTFDVKSTGSDITVRTLTATTTGDTLLSNVKLYDGSTLLGVKAASSTVVFDNLNVAIAKDATKILTIKVDVKGNGTGTVSAAIPSGTANVSAIDSQYNPVQTVNGGAISNTMTSALKGPVFTFVSATNNLTQGVSGVSSAYLTGTITFKVKAMGGLISKYTGSDISMFYVKSDNTSSAVTNTYVQVAPDQDITDGNEATITVQGTVSSTTATGFTYFRLNNVTSTIDSVAVATPYSTTGILGTFKTPAVNLQ